MLLRKLDKPSSVVLQEQIPLPAGEHTGIPHSNAASCGPSITHAGHAVDLERPAVRLGNGQGHNFAIGVCI